MIRRLCQSKSWPLKYNFRLPSFRSRHSISVRFPPAAAGPRFTKSLSTPASLLCSCRVPLPRPGIVCRRKLLLGIGYNFGPPTNTQAKEQQLSIVHNSLCGRRRWREVDCGWPPKENGGNAQTDIKLRHFTFISRKLFIFTRTTDNDC